MGLFDTFKTVLGGKKPNTDGGSGVNNGSTVQDNPPSPGADPMDASTPTAPPEVPGTAAPSATHPMNDSSITTTQESSLNEAATNQSPVVTNNANPDPLAVTSDNVLDGTTDTIKYSNFPQNTRNEPTTSESENPMTTPSADDPSGSISSPTATIPSEGSHTDMATPPSPYPSEKTDAANPQQKTS